MEPEAYDNIVRFLVADGASASRYERDSSGSDRRVIRRKIKKFRMEAGRLYYGHRQVVRGDEEKNLILRNLHAGIGGAHLGINKTVYKIAEKYYWVGIRADVQEVIKHCDECLQQNSRPENSLKKPRASILTPIPVSNKAWDLVGIDLIGPLVQSDDGNRYIIVATEYLTKWPEAKAIPAKEAFRVADFIDEYIVCRHGCPAKIIINQGREFCDELNESVFNKFGIEHEVTSAYHPKTYGLTDRFNQTLCNLLLKNTDQKSNWDKVIPKVLLAYRVSKQKSSKFSPFLLNTGRQIRLPVEVDGFSDSENDLDVDKDGDGFRDTENDLQRDKDGNFEDRIQNLVEQLTSQ